MTYSQKEAERKEAERLEAERQRKLREEQKRREEAERELERLKAKAEQHNRDKTETNSAPGDAHARRVNTEKVNDSTKSSWSDNDEVKNDHIHLVNLPLLTMIISIILSGIAILFIWR